MPQAISLLVSELQQNTRLRIGIWLVIFILMTYVVLWSNEYSQQLIQTHSEAVTHLTRLQTLATQTQWLEHTKQADELLAQLEARLWQADSKGLAQATFQKWFNNQISSAKIDNVRLKVDPAIEVPQHPHLWQVTAQLDANFSPSRFYTLLLALEKNLQITMTESLDIHPTRAKPQFTLIVTAFFKATTAAS